jgi:hypothetical protein
MKYRSEKFECSECGQEIETDIIDECYVVELKEALEESRELFREIELHCKHTEVRNNAHDGQVLVDEILNN